MMDLEDLYAYADDHGYMVDWFMPTRADGFVVEMPWGETRLIMDPAKVRSRAEHKVKLGHGLGHAETGAVYTMLSPYAVVEQQERRADKWEIKHLISKKDLEEAVAQGYTEVWELAERFEVTEEFMRQAIVWYKYGTTDTSGYFETA